MAKNTENNTKNRLLNSAALLFSEKGFSGVSIREICKHAETSMNMIHHYFENKKGLFDAVIDQFSSNVFSVPMWLIEKNSESKEDLIKKFELLFEATLDAYIEHKILFMLVMKEQAYPTALIEYQTRFVEFLEAAKEKGFVRKELDSNMINGFLLDRITNQILYAPWIKGSYGVDIENDPQYKARWCKSNIDLFIHGIIT